MTTNATVIGDALREIGVISEIETPSAEQGSHALRKLNQLIETWTEIGISLGYFKQSSTTDDCPIPEWSEKGVIAGLAIDLAPTYGATVTQELAAKYTEGYGVIIRKATVENMRPARMDHMPLGEGYRIGNSILTDS